MVANPCGGGSDGPGCCGGKGVKGPGCCGGKGVNGGVHIPGMGGVPGGDAIVANGQRNTK